MHVVDGLAVFNNEWNGDCGPNKDEQAYRQCCRDLRLLAEQDEN